MVEGRISIIGMNIMVGVSVPQTHDPLGIQLNVPDVLAGVSLR